MRLKKNSLFYVFGLILILSFESCSTLKESGKDVVPPVDYTEADVLKNEIIALNKKLEEKPVYVLWRSFLLKESFPENDEVMSLYNEACKLNLGLYEDLRDSSDIENRFEALRLITSIEAVGYSSALSLSEFKNSLYSEVPGYKLSKPSKIPVGEMIKGTVTVFVDKGIKVQNGLGYADSVLGSGFFISSDGYIVTNHHVIEDVVDKKNEGFSRLYIKLAEDPDTKIPAKVVGFDKSLDLALLKTQIDAPYVFDLGSSSDLSVGDKIYVIGSPLGLDKTLTSGIISSFDRQVFINGTVFQIDAAVNSGNSGGPMIDEQGRVQGIVFAGVQFYQGLNFAIPVEYLKIKLPFLYNGGERHSPWIGAYGKTKRLPGSGMKNEGVIVYYVMPGSSSDRAGIKENDVIVSVNGIEITSLDELKLLFMQCQEESIVRIGITDESGNTSSKLVYLEKRPESPGYEFYKRDLLGQALYPILGMDLAHSSSVNKRSYIIKKIIRSSSADESGFSENDPVEVVGVDFNDDYSAAYFRITTQKRKKGFLEVSLMIPAALNTPYYF